MDANTRYFHNQYALFRLWMFLCDPLPEQVSIFARHNSKFEAWLLENWEQDPACALLRELK